MLPGADGVTGGLLVEGPSEQRLIGGLVGPDLDGVLEVDERALEVAHLREDLALAEGRLGLGEARHVDLGHVSVAPIVGGTLLRVGEGLEGLGDAREDTRRIVPEVAESQAGEGVGMVFLGRLEVGLLDLGRVRVRRDAERGVVVELRQAGQALLDLGAQGVGLLVLRTRLLAQRAGAATGAGPIEIAGGDL
ncbi:MAG TPA: hypothetical protein PLW10_04240, partial [Myxococcota bacterium]|nr:hypothetical protein [Myxococcota bacterium]